MTCPSQNEQTSDLLLEYAAGRLDKVRARELEKHMLICAACTALRDGQSAVWDALDTWEPASVSTDFNHRLWQRIDRLGTGSWYSRLREALSMANWKPALPLAAAMVAVVGGFMMDHQTRRTIDPVAAPAHSQVSALEAEQIEQTLEDIQLLRQFNNVTNL